ncbi:hypothetical protein A5708_08395 [Mycobacterium colombiense]|uniref:Uncharacterized protein n=1 Tax=Mycobacterium colombiense TaxID=339268 RepID=A0A1A2YGE1_9MYCO|nr:hypothetical protein A5708_08395 [Mycobacterium colombiense]
MDRVAPVDRVAPGDRAGRVGRVDRVDPDVPDRTRERQRDARTGELAGRRAWELRVSASRYTG